MENPSEDAGSRPCLMKRKDTGECMQWGAPKADASDYADPAAEIQKNTPDDSGGYSDQA